MKVLWTYLEHSIREYLLSKVSLKVFNLILQILNVGRDEKKSHTFSGGNLLCARDYQGRDPRHSPARVLSRQKVVNFSRSMEGTLPLALLAALSCLGSRRKTQHQFRLCFPTPLGLKRYWSFVGPWPKIHRETRRGLDSDGLKAATAELIADASWPQKFSQSFGWRRFSPIPKAQSSQDGGFQGGPLKKIHQLRPNKWCHVFPMETNHRLDGPGDFSPHCGPSSGTGDPDSWLNAVREHPVERSCFVEWQS